jgi:hypothetical protein
MGRFYALRSLEKLKGDYGDFWIFSQGYVGMGHRAIIRKTKAGPKNDALPRTPLRA